jgi:DNA repair protein RadD
MPLWDHQRLLAANILSTWQRGVRRIVGVLPTGGGKTRVASYIVGRALGSGAKVLAVCHRRELVDQLVERLPQAGRVGSGKPVIVSTLQSMVSGGVDHDAHLVVIDECHHLPNDQLWYQTLKRWEHARWLGLTATPQRGDGKPLGDTFQEMIVGAHYRQLIANGHLVGARVWTPEDRMENGELSMDPLEAYQKHCPGEQAFIFCRGVDEAYDLGIKFNQAGVTSSVIEGNTRKNIRDHEIAMFKEGKRQVLINVHVLTEGFDAPSATACILARRFGHPSTYLQCVGRVLRCHPGKKEAKLIDLCSNVHAHGLPTDNRDYSLEGKAMRVTAGSALKLCMSCGLTFEHGKACPECGEVLPVLRERGRQRVTATPMREVGVEELSQIQKDSLEQLLWQMREYSRTVWWLLHRASALKIPVPVGLFNDDDKAREFFMLQKKATQNNWRGGYAWVMFKRTFGHNPQPQHFPINSRWAPEARKAGVIT